MRHVSEDKKGLKTFFIFNLLAMALHSVESQPTLKHSRSFSMFVFSNYVLLTWFNYYGYDLQKIIFIMNINPHLVERWGLTLTVQEALMSFKDSPKKNEDIALYLQRVWKSNKSLLLK